MRRRRRRRCLRTALLLVAAAACGGGVGGGCQPKPAPATTPAAASTGMSGTEIESNRPVIVALPRPKPGEAEDPELSLDPCADRLHEISGLLLQYLSKHDRLPPTLKELSGARNLNCPVSGKPYAYTNVGVPFEVKGFSGRVVVMDSVPIHNGVRWGIALAVPEPGKPLSTRIVVVPEGTPTPW